MQKYAFVSSDDGDGIDDELCSVVPNLDVDIVDHAHPSSPPRQRPRTVLLLLFISYCGVYFCRANVSVISATLVKDSILGIDEVEFGGLISAGTFMYACGKMLSGVTPIAQPTLRIKAAMLLTSLATLAFSASPSYGAMVLCWLLSRLVQSQIWTNFAVVINETYGAKDRGAGESV